MANLINDKERHCEKVTIVDDCMGSGKTSWAIQYINQSPLHQKFIFITLFLDEVDRVVQSVKGRTFKKPAPKGTKLQDVKRQIQKGHNIATTHTLFKSFDKEILLLLKTNNYVLIIDEVLEVVEHVLITKSDIKILRSSDKITINENKVIHWNKENYDGKFLHIKHLCETEKVFLHHESAMFRTFPVEIIMQFTEVFILTYMFDCQIQRYYFDLNGIEFEKKSVIQVGENSNGEKIYALTDYIQRSAQTFKNLITVYEGKMNNNWLPKKRNLSQGYDDLTYTKLTSITKDSKITKSLRRNLESFFKNYSRKNDFNMWTCPIDAKSYLKGKGYTGSNKNVCFVAHNARATNDFGHKSTLAYVLNKYMSPTIVGFFKDNGIEIDQDTYALSELLQWIFRSRVRNGEPIELFIPSLRMRTLLQKWLNDEPIQWGKNSNPFIGGI